MNIMVDGYYDKKYKWKCVKCGNEFEDHIYSHIPRCLKCYPFLAGKSNEEQELVDFCKQHFTNIIQHDRKIIAPYELDIVIPDLHLALEFNGNYWHSIEAGLNSNYHIIKTELCEARNYRLIHIWEDEWNNDKELIKEKLIQVFEDKEIIDYSKPLDRSWYSIFQVQNKNIEILPPEVIERNGYHVENCGYLKVKND